MTPKPSFRPYVFSTIFLLIIGWGGLYALTLFSLPTIWPRWGFFALWIIALTATVFPVIYFITTRFSSGKFEPHVMVRQALWVGIFGALLAWLQLARLVNIYVILSLAFGLVAIESLLRLRERARWRVPDVDEDDKPA
jgi:hypothetical protein